MDWAGVKYEIDFFEKCLFWENWTSNRGQKTYKLRRFDVLRVATGSSTVQSKRIASRMLFKWVPGLQDVKNGSTRDENVENPQNQIFAGFLALFFPLGRRHLALAREMRRGRAQPCLQRRARSVITSCLTSCQRSGREKKTFSLPLSSFFFLFSV